jgi:hypothetical protein
MHRLQPIFYSLRIIYHKMPHKLSNALTIISSPLSILMYVPGIKNAVLSKA